MRRKYYCRNLVWRWEEWRGGGGEGGHKKSLLEGTLIFNRGLEIFKKGVLDKKGVTKK